MIEAFIQGVGVCGPGFDGWDTSVAVLAGAQEYIQQETRLVPPAILPPNERRRTGTAVRLALSVAHQASEMAGIRPGSIASIFATSTGDGVVMHAILETLTAHGPVSPTQFHNSVHNAAAGYWSIGTGSRQPASCLAGHDATPAAALLKAIAAIHVEREPVLLCIYDSPLPPPLDTGHSMQSAFGVGLVLTPLPNEAALSRLSIMYSANPPPPGSETPHLPALQPLARSNTAARMLRLLETLARGAPDTLSLALLDGHVNVTLSPCSRACRSSN